MKMRIITNNDITTINKWLKRRGAPAVKKAELPVRCFIVPGVACMGIRAIEGGMWLLDSLASNPLVSSSTRHKAIEALYERLLSVPAGDTVLGFTNALDAYGRAIAMGFRPINQVILSYKRGI